MRGKPGKTTLPLLRNDLLFRYTGIFGKDLIKGTQIIIVMGILLWSWPTLNFFIAALRPNNSPDFQIHTNLLIFMLFATCYAIGLFSVGDEMDHETNIFLNRLPVNQLALHLKKVFTSIILVSLWLIGFCIIPGMIIGLTTPQFHELKSFIFTDHNILRGFSLFLTGLISGQLSRGNVLKASIIGFVCYGTFVITVTMIFMIFSGSNLSNIHLLFNSIGFQISLYIWISLMILVSLVHIIINKDEKPSQLIFPVQVKPKYIFQYPRKSIHPSSLANEQLRPMRNLSPFLAMVLFCLFSQFSTNKYGINPLQIGSLALICSISGSYAWKKEERDKREFFIYTLPTNETNFIKDRLLVLIKIGVSCAIAAWIGELLGIILFRNLQFETPIQLGVFLILTISLSISFCFMGMLFRLFCKSIIISTASTLILGSIWTCTIVFLCYSAELRKWEISPTDPETIEMVLWPSLIVMIVPAFLAIFLPKYSMLLEMNESLRSLSLLFLFVFLSIWVPFLILISPLDLIRMVLL